MKPSLRRDIVFTLILSVLGAVFSYISVNIPNTEVYFDFRWIFGSIAFAVLSRWYLPLAAALVLSLSGPHQVPLHIVLIGNMLWAVPSGLSLRFLAKQLYKYQTNPFLFGIIWFAAILLGYQLFHIPLIWSVLGFIRNEFSFSFILEGYKLQPFLEESFFVGIISALGMTIYNMYNSMKEREHYFNTVLNCIGDAVITTDTNSAVQFMNPEAEKLTGWKKADASSKPLSIVYRIANSYDSTPVNNPVEKVLSEGKTVGLANHTMILAKDGKEYQIADSAAPIIDDKGIINGVVLVFRDITRSYRIQESLSKNLKEKEILLKEIHHRVKNNLQIIISLLQLQANTITHEIAKKKLLEGQRRIYALALVHEQLYHTDDFAKIPFNNYVSDLLKNIINTESPQIAWSCDIPKIYLDIEILTPCGLILSELISNSLEHGFPEGTGKIDIAVEMYESDRIRIIYKDDGIGLPRGLDPRETETLGLRLIRSLVEQLEGSVEITSHPGLQYTIIIPVSEIKS
ncbi:MAG: histidine kinase dimerization/phosphoacceptor domain -containing protein [Spirochaetia bacterium]